MEVLSPSSSTGLERGVIKQDEAYKRTNKRKLKQVENGEDADGEHVKRKRSREERKAAKRLKKQRKEAERSKETDGPNQFTRHQNTSSETGESASNSTRKAFDHVGNIRADRASETNISSSIINELYKESPALTALPKDIVDEFLNTHGIAIDDPSPTSPPYRPITDFAYLPHMTHDDKSSFAKFSAPTPIQAAAWPFLFSGRDVIGIAETGSGKTLAFGVPLIRSVIASPSKSSRSHVRAVVVSPTRELAVQIHTQLETLATKCSLHTVCVYGGVPKEEQRSALTRASIVVATPGRLNDLVEEGSADLRNVNYLVLDEADRMLDKGFEDSIRKIISSSLSDGNRQTLMFTATWPPSVRDLASTFLQSPVHISIGKNNPSNELRANKSITQQVEVIDPMQKQSRLLALLRQHHAGRKSSQHAGKESKRILIFALYKKEAARIESVLHAQHYPVVGIHGDMSQSSRSASLSSFKSGTCPLLVATDVAARGLDIPDVHLVINLTFPLTVEDYVHRIGRTGRAGKTGLAVTLFTEHDKSLAGGLVNVLKAAGQEVPENLLKFGTTVKKKEHEAYGAFYRKSVEGEKAQGTKIRF